MTGWRSIKKAVGKSATLQMVNHVAGDAAVATRVGQAFVFSEDILITKAYALAKTAPVGAAMLIDINADGTTAIGATKLTVADGATSGTLTPANPISVT